MESQYGPSIQFFVVEKSLKRRVFLNYFRKLGIMDKTSLFALQFLLFSLHSDKQKSAKSKLA